MMPNPLLSPLLTARVTPVPGTCFGLELCGACPENGESRSAFYRNNHCSYNAAYCTITMSPTSVLICLAIGATPRPNAARRSYSSQPQFSHMNAV